MSRTRNVCFTLNNYTTADIDKGVEFGTNKCTYLVYGEEIGELGTPHLQGYLELNDPMSFSALQKKTFSFWMPLRILGRQFQTSRWLLQERLMSPRHSLPRL